MTNKIDDIARVIKGEKIKNPWPDLHYSKWFYYYGYEWRDGDHDKVSDKCALNLFQYVFYGKIKFLDNQISIDKLTHEMQNPKTKKWFPVTQVPDIAPNEYTDGNVLYCEDKDWKTRIKSIRESFYEWAERGEEPKTSVLATCHPEDIIEEMKENDKEFRDRGFDGLIEEIQNLQKPNKFEQAMRDGKIVYNIETGKRYTFSGNYFGDINSVGEMETVGCYSYDATKDLFLEMYDYPDRFKIEEKKEEEIIGGRTADEWGEAIFYAGANKQSELIKELIGAAKEQGAKEALNNLNSTT